MVYRHKPKRKGGSHGRGSHKKQRGAGNRGGRGRAGLGKKAQHRKFAQLREGKGKGFKSVQQLKQRKHARNHIINLDEIAVHFESLRADGFIEESDGYYVFDADKAGVKVLGRGTLPDTIRVKASRYARHVEPYLVK